MSHFMCGVRTYARLITRVCLLLLFAVPLTAQTEFSETGSGDEIISEEERPMACPTGLAPGFEWSPSGYPQEFEGETYWFGNAWFMKQDQQGRGYTIADYYASGGFYMDPPDVLDDSGVLYWRQAGHRQECSIRITRRRDGSSVQRRRFKQLDEYGHLERVRTACSGGGGSVDAKELQPIGDYAYDPYAATAGGDGCPGSGGGGSGGGGSTDEKEVAGGGTCGGSTDLYYDYICIDIWVAGIGWVQWWCGVAAICG